MVWYSFSHNALYHVSSGKLYTCEELLQELRGSVGIRGITDKNTGCWMVKNGIAFIRAAIIEGDTKQMRVILKLRGTMEAKLSVEKQLIIVDGQGVTVW